MVKKPHELGGLVHALVSNFGRKMGLFLKRGVPSFLFCAMPDSTFMLERLVFCAFDKLFPSVHISAIQMISVNRAKFDAEDFSHAPRCLQLSRKYQLFASGYVLFISPEGLDPFSLQYRRLPLFFCLDYFLAYNEFLTRFWIHCVVLVIFNREASSRTTVVL